MNSAIVVENVSKQYRLGQVGTGSLVHDLNRWWHLFRGKDDPYLKIGELNDRTSKGQSDYVWALRDINFQVEKGAVLGIIGRNGAGKSTLLKILSRTTSPTTGSLKIKGRIASLLEVGTGFHPELSGRDNIFLNGAILGMTRAEIKSKFDEIVDFSGVERYIDTPVKRYSSGMYVRLAFAVAAHLDSDILIVDEVLAVGDAEFQKKCIGKMSQVSSGQGKTVLFVSHDISAVKRLCNVALMMDKGTIIEDGLTESVIEKYIKSQQLGDNLKYIASEDDQRNEIYFKQIFLADQSQTINADFSIEDRLFFNIELEHNDRSLTDTSLLVTINDLYKRKVFSCITPIADETRLTLELAPRQLTRGSYTITAILYKLGVKQYHVAEEICAFNITDMGSEFDGLYTFDYGVTFADYIWHK